MTDRSCQSFRFNLVEHCSIHSRGVFRVSAEVGLHRIKIVRLKRLHRSVITEQ